jgi:hypothetical protein
MIAAALLLAAAPVQPSQLAGLYQTSQMEMAGALELAPNGHFRYQLEYGAASESAEGDWSLDGDTVRLTSNPMPKQPRFTLISDNPAPKGELWLLLEKSAIDLGGPLHAIVTLEGEAEPALIVADQEGRVDLRGQRVTTVQPLMPVYEAAADPVTLSADRGHKLLFRFEPNEMGRAAFSSEPLQLDGSSLLLQRYETVIRFTRVKR